MVKFRETLWFKRGELVDIEADDERVELPIEDRYLDSDGVSQTETALFGVHSGETAALPRIRINATSATAAISCDPQGVVLQSLIREFKQRNTRLIAMIGAAVLVLAVWLFGVL